MPWQMLLPCIVVVDGKPEADVITSITSRWQMLLSFFYFVADGKPHTLHVTAFEDGRCYCQVGDGIATAGWMTDNW